MANKVIWFEVIGKETSKLQSFYANLFGWNLKKTDGDDYKMTDPEQTGIGGGIGTVPGGGSWATFYVGVDDIEKAIAQAEKLGGKVLVPIMKLPEVTFAVITDPEGHPVGIAQEP